MEIITKFIPTGKQGNYTAKTIYKTADGHEFDNYDAAKDHERTLPGTKLRIVIREDNRS